MAAEGVIAGEARSPLALGASVVPLLALMVFIQYVDRGNLATAAPLMKKRLGLTAAQIGLLISAFYWTYVPGQLLSGWLTHRLNAYRTLAIGLAMWSLATFATGLAGGFAALIAWRLVLGLGESTAFPCSSGLLARRLPASRLGAANGLTGVGVALGPAIGIWAAGNLMAVAGWRPTFLVFGLVSILWLAPWRRATRHLDHADRAAPGPPAPRYLEVVKRRDLWGASLGHFCSNYALYFVVSWLPLYLVQARGFSMSQMAEVGGMVYGVYAASCFAGGWLSDRWIRAGASTNLVRKGAIIVGQVVVGSSLIACSPWRRRPLDRLPRCDGGRLGRQLLALVHRPDPGRAKSRRQMGRGPELHREYRWHRRADRHRNYSGQDEQLLLGLRQRRRCLPPRRGLLGVRRPQGRAAGVVGSPDREGPQWGRTSPSPPCPEADPHGDRRQPDVGNDAEGWRAAASLTQRRCRLYDLKAALAVHGALSSRRGRGAPGEDLEVRLLSRPSATAACDRAHPCQPLWSRSHEVSSTRRAAACPVVRARARA
jgi:MFS family permease